MYAGIRRKSWTILLGLIYSNSLLTEIQSKWDSLRNFFSTINSFSFVLSKINAISLFFYDLSFHLLIFPTIFLIFLTLRHRPLSCSFNFLPCAHDFVSGQIAPLEALKLTHQLRRWNEKSQSKFTRIFCRYVCARWHFSQENTR